MRSPPTLPPPQNLKRALAIQLPLRTASIKRGYMGTRVCGYDTVGGLCEVFMRD